MAQEKALEMDRRIAFETALVLVIIPRRRKLPEPGVDNFEQFTLFVVHDDSGVRVERRGENHAVTERVLFHGGLDPIRDGDDLARLFRLQSDLFAADFHGSSRKMATC